MPDQDPIEASAAEQPPAEQAAAEAAPEALPAAEPAELPGCTCGVGEKPRAYHDDECAVWEGAYDPPARSIEPSSLPVRGGAVGSAIADLPVIPAGSEMNSIAQLAVTLAAAGACPSAIRGKPNDVFLVLLSARDLGVSLTTAMREFHVIEGKVTLSPKVKLALVRQSGLGKMWPAADNGAEAATWHAERKDLPGQVISSTFTWADAQLAHLVDSRCTPHEHWRGERARGANSADCLCKSNWKTYPARMLSWRSAGYLLDDVYPEVGTGLYSPDELGAVTDADGEPISVTAVESLPGMRGGQRPGGGGQAAGEPEPISEEQLAELRPRTDRVKAHAEANADLKAWWGERQLPPLAALSAPQGRLLEAKLAQVESVHGLDAPIAGAEQAAAQQAEGGTEAQQEPAAPAEAPGATESPIQGQEEQAPEQEWTSHDDVGGWPTVAEIKAAKAEREPEPEDPDPHRRNNGAEGGPPDGDVAAWLIAAAGAMDGPQIKTAYTLAELEPPKGNLALLRRSWGIWQFEQLGAGLCAALSLGSIEAASAIAAFREEGEA